jgi:putative ABC transport system permease protein
LAIIVTAAGAISSMNSFLIVVLGKTLGSDYMLVPPSVGVWSSNIGANSGLADRLRAVPGVDAVSTIRFAMSQSDGKTVSVLGIDPVVFPQVAGLNFQQGDAVTAFAALDVGRTLIANGPLASQLGLGAGDTMRLSTPTGSQEYTIVAVAGDYLNAKIPSAYISQRLVRQDFRKTDDVFVQVNLADGARAVDVEARLKSIVTDYPQFKLISRQVYQDQTKQAVDAALIMYTFILAALAIPSLIALLNTLAIGVIERTREIGMLRAVGATRSQVRRMVLAEALLLAAVGTVLGLIAGLYLSYVSVLGLGASGYPLAYSFPVWGLVAAAVIGLGFGALAAVIPARQAAGLEIVRALQYE